MNNIIIGTAGHVDHGKTTLIKALTGVDTDRLKEEKERGITIELGFAYLCLPNGQKCGIIDVPGHEKFVRNMLAGANSVDLALFVVAGDEGIMPQSREHLEILSLLNIKRGIIAVTKVDTVEQDWLDMVISDIKEEVEDTFLKNAQVIPVSAKTGQGIENLRQALIDMVLNDCQEEKEPSLFRLPVDRVFSKDGFGTVITGTITDGEVSVGEEIILYPSMIQSKVRTLQVHGQSVQTAMHGQRTAINLASIKTDEIKKGCALASPKSMQNTAFLDVRLDIVKSTKRRIENNSRLHLYLGTADITCKVVLFSKDEIKNGESCYAQLRLDQPIAARLNDRFVVRFYSPMETVGGGVILDPNPGKRARTDKSAIKLFEQKEKGNLNQKIEAFILDRSKFFPSLKELKINPFLNDRDFDNQINNLVESNQIFLVKDAVVHKAYIDVITKKCTEILNEFHKNSPLLEGIKKEELRSKLLHKSFQTYFDVLLAIMEDQKSVLINGNTVALANFKICLSDNQKRITDEITQVLLNAGYSTPSFDELAQKYAKEQKGFKQCIDALVSQGILIMLTPQILIHKEYLDKAIKAATAFNREFTLAEFRDSLNTSRKYAVAILEYFDDKQITTKQGESRIMR